jgi:7,8-dihydropterin-6-yl-methyl-4-(beta-D-ribofuranosyl)aminobenzene 5'-phosphate synthase
MTIDARRRHLLLGSAAVASQALLPSLAWAQSATVNAPVVDSLTVRVLTDSSYDSPRVGSHKMVKTKRMPPLGSGRKGFHNEWGLALAIESRVGDETRHTLLDFGFTPAALMNNLAYMNQDPAKFQHFIVSHGHGDHWGGLVGFVEKNRAQLPQEMVLHIGGEDLFCARSRGRGPSGHLTDADVLDRRDLERLKVRVVTCEKATIVGHAFTTGWIPRQSFESVQGPLPLVQYFPADGLGCSIPDANAKAGGKPTDDAHIHEHATCFNVKGRGLVVISSCGHAGIINSARRAMEVSGVGKLHCAMGGFHLFGASPEYLRKTLDEFKALNADVLVPMHCSGPSLVALLNSEVSDRVITSTPGTEFVFGV